MVETITPVVHGGRRGKWAAAVAAHMAGAGLSAAAFGAALGAAGTLLGAPWGVAGRIAVAAIAALYAVQALAGLPVPIPERRRQVPEWWRTFFSPSTAAFLYGAGLGIGFLTYLRFGTLLAVSAAAAASGHPGVGAAMLVPFGLARSGGVAVVAGARTSGDVGRTVDRLEALGASRVPAVANGVALVALAAAALLWGPAGDAGSLGSAPAMLLAAVFGWAAVAKVARPSVWREAIEAHALPGPVAAMALGTVPIAEAAVPALVLFGEPRAAGALALVLLGGFTAALLRVRRLRPGKLPCGCFGKRRARDPRLLLARNAALAGVATVTVTTGGPVGDALVAVPSSGPGDVLPVALTVLGVLVGTLLVRRATVLLRPR
jgi:hypothetical protein